VADLKGKLKEVLGWATGDRRVQAEGRVEKVGGDHTDAATVEAAEDQVRRDEGDTKTSPRA
jgi:uncharacterized protein YjbJ (UPF0337 family)